MEQILLKKIKKKLKSIKTENIYIIIAIFFGLIVLFLIPPTYIPDEAPHFYRAYMLTDFKMDVYRSPNGTIGAELPVNLVKFIMSDAFQWRLGAKANSKMELNDVISLSDKKLDQDNKKFFTIKKLDGAALEYTPIPYIFSSQGILLGRFFNLPPLWLLYLGRIFNMIAFIFFVYLAIKITPVGKLIFLSLALMPMCIMIGSIISIDNFTISIVFLLVAYILKLSHDPNIKLIKKEHLLVLSAIVLFLSFSKQVYIFLILLFFIIPFNKFKKRRYYLAFFCMLCLIVIITNGIWMVFTLKTNINESFNALNINKINSGHGDNILSYRIKSIIPFIKSMYYEPDWLSYTARFTGINRINKEKFNEVGKLSIVLGSIYLLFILFISFTCYSKIKINIKNKLIILFNFIIVFLIIFYIFFQLFYPEKNYIIKGVQGRYFIPIAPLLFLFLLNNKIKLNRLFLNTLTVSFATCFLIVNFLLLLKNTWIL